MIALQLLPERNCSKCTVAQQKLWGCETTALQPLNIDGKDVWRCPRRPIKEEPEFWAKLVDAYAMLNVHHVLPEEGGSQSQPALLMECINLMRSTLAEGEDAQIQAAKVRQQHSAGVASEGTMPGPEIRSVKPKAKLRGKKGA